VDGLFVVSGFSGHGFMHGPVAGKLMAELMLDRAYQSLDVSALDLARFDEGRLIQEYNVV
jgi:sarcosine oxidase subunit beta